MKTYEDRILAEELLLQELGIGPPGSFSQHLLSPKARVPSSEERLARDRDLQRRVFRYTQGYSFTGSKWEFMRGLNMLNSMDCLMGVNPDNKDSMHSRLGRAGGRRR